MRNQEAERYARWAAYGAAAILLVVAGVFSARSFRAWRGRQGAPAPVPATVQQQSAQFSFSKVEQDRTLFTVRASHATQFRDEDRAVLEDVWITVYGPKGDRNDNIHTRECSYEPRGGDVRCEGEVEIEIASAGAAAQKLRIKTRDLSFNRDTGRASTPAGVEFEFAGGRGSGTGVDYRSSDAILQVEKAVEFQIDPSDRTDGMPLNARGTSLEVRRDDRQVLLHGPAIVREGDRELAADQISVILSADNQVQSLVAEGHPKIQAHEGAAQVLIRADRIEASLNPAGWIERVTLDGNLDASRDSKAERDQFTAQRAVLEMLPGSNLARQMTLTGQVFAQSKASTSSRTLKTEALQVSFSSAPLRATGNETAAAAKGFSAKQTLSLVKTLAPASIETVAVGETTSLQAKRFVAEADDSGRLDKLYGHDAVNVRRQTGKDAPQDISAAELVATFSPSGDWETVDEKGGVHFRQLDREVTAQHATFVRSTNVVTLEGSPILSDSESRTTAANVVINQQTGEIRAGGGVLSSYSPTRAQTSTPKAASPATRDSSANSAGAIGFGAGEAHVAADTFSASLPSGDAVYEGHSRLWQDQSVLNADRIELFRDEKRLLATGHVVAAFVQEASPFSQEFGQAAAARPAVKSAKSPAPLKTAPPASLWKLTAPSLAYSSEQGRVRLEGGVSAASEQGSIQAETMDVFLDSPAAVANRSADPPPAREFSRVVAEGRVVVRQGERTGSAERGEYVASDGKFVLSGGHPTLADNSSNTVTGRSLTFFSASDTILIDSQEGSRTLTKHQVEK